MGGASDPAWSGETERGWKLRSFLVEAYRFGCCSSRERLDGRVWQAFSSCCHLSGKNMEPNQKYILGRINTDFKFSWLSSTLLGFIIFNYSYRYSITLSFYKKFILFIYILSKLYIMFLIVF